MAEDESGSSKFVVKDRRRFDSEGNDRGAEERETSPRPSSPAGAIKPQASKPEEPKFVRDEPPVKPQSAPRDLGPPPETDLSFSQFIISLATQTLMQLGEIQPPDGMPIAVDKEGARQTIDILSVIEYKTRGNLNDEEAKLMEEILHNLRLSYVRHSKQGA